MRATAEESDAAAALIAEYLDKVGDDDDIPQSRTEVDAHVGVPQRALFLATHGQALVGCIFVHPLSSSNAYEVKRMYVRERYRRRGIGAALLRAAESFAAQNDARCIYLETKSRLLGAIALYEAFGYERIDPYGARPRGDVFMRKEVYRSV